MLQFFLRILAFLRDGIFPASCLGCGLEGSFLCDGCQKILIRLENALCFKQTTPVFNEPSVGHCLNQPDEWFCDAVWASCDFEKNPLLQKAIHGLKYDFLVELARPLGKLVAPTLADVAKHEHGLGRSVVLCPLPLHRKRERWRGFNQSVLLAQSALCSYISDDTSSTAPQPRMEMLLERIHFARPQMELTREERKQNIANAFRCLQLPSLPGQTVVLVDDVATTLSTLHSAAQCLKNAGYERVCGLVLARVF